MPRFSRCFAVLVLVLLVLPAALQAAPLPNASAWAAWDVLAQVWSFLTAQSDNGCWIDPSGLCLPGQAAAVTTDNGCWIDPDGRCRN
jgi:hypothetical protein